MSNPSIHRAASTPITSRPTSSPPQITRSESTPQLPTTKATPTPKTADPQLINTEAEGVSIENLIDNLGDEDMDLALTQSQVLSEQNLDLQEKTPAEQLQTLNDTVKNNPEVKAKINDYKALFGKGRFSESVFADFSQPLKGEFLAFRNASVQFNKTVMSLNTLLSNKTLSPTQKEDVKQLQSDLREHLHTFNESHQNLKTLGPINLKALVSTEPLKGRLNAVVHTPGKDTSNNEVSAFMHGLKMMQSDPTDAIKQLMQSPLDQNNDGLMSEIIAQELQHSDDPAGSLSSLVNALPTESTTLQARQNQIFQGISVYLEKKLEGRATDTIDAMIGTLQQPEIAEKMGSKGTECCVRLALHPISQAPEKDTTEHLTGDLVRLEKAHPQNKKSTDPFARPTAVEVECGNYGSYQSVEDLMGQVQTRISSLVNDKTSQSDLKTLAHRTLMLPDTENYHQLFDHLAQSHHEARLNNPNESHYGKTYKNITFEKDAFNALLGNKSHVCLERIVFEDPERQTASNKHAFRYTGAIEGSEARRITGREQALGTGSNSLVVGYEGGGTHSSAGHVSFASSIENHFKNPKNSKVNFDSSAQRIDNSARFITVKAPMLLLSKTDDWRPNAGVDPHF